MKTKQYHGGTSGRKVQHNGNIEHVTSHQEKQMGAGRIWEELYGNYSHKVKKEGELGAALNSLNCWTQSSVCFVWLTDWLLFSGGNCSGTITHTVMG